MDVFRVWCAVLIALATPLLLVIVRHEVRLARLRALFEFDQLFNPGHKIKGGHEPESAGRLPPTYEYVRSRYTDDIEFPEDIHLEWIRKFDMRQPRFRYFIRHLKWWRLKSSRMILWASLPLTVFLAFGLLVLFGGTSPGGWLAPLADWPAPALVAGLGTASGQTTMLVANTMVVAESAFVGAYLFVLLVFLRALATFDLSPLTVLRATVYFVAAILASVVLYRSFPDAPAQAVDAVGNLADGTRTSVSRVLGHAPPPPTAKRSSPSPPPGPPGKPPGGHAHTPRYSDDVAPLSKIWIALAFLMGMTPDLAVNTLVSQVQKRVRMKSTDDRFLPVSPSTPLEIIDGIDVLTRFRLQESNVFEVQNLAVSNPILLFIETPFGIYQVIDWVAQAQLCVAVGPARFLELRRRSIRTIFDLERAVLSVYTTSQLRRYVASVLLAPAPQVAARESGIAILAFLGLAARPGGEALEPRAESPFDLFTAQLFSAQATAADGTSRAPDPDETIKHFVRLLADDLHVCRLRQVWQQIMTTINDGPFKPTDRLWDTPWLPPIPDPVDPPAEP